MGNKKATKKGAVESSPTGNNNNNNLERNGLPSLPLATAIRNNDTTALAQALQSKLPTAVAHVSDVKLTTTVGEAFTGGRSTPVYAVECIVHRQRQYGVGAGEQANPTKRESTNNNTSTTGVPTNSETQQSTIPKKRHFIIKLVWMENEQEHSDKNGDASIDPQLEHLRESYAIERRFYSSDAEARIRATSTSLMSSPLTIPRLVASDLDGSRPWPVACFVLNDLTYQGFTEHPHFLSQQQAQCALQWVAQLHALFWKENSATPTTATSTVPTTTSSFAQPKPRPWQSDLWATGGFWNAKVHLCSFDKIATNWISTVQWLQQAQTKHASAANSVFLTDRTKGLGQRFQALAAPLQEYLTTQSTNSGVLRSYGTLIHGDYKAANLFFRPMVNQDDGDKIHDTNNKNNNNTNRENHEGAATVAAVDFQYTGAGIGASDVAYLLYPDARGDFWEVEEDLLRLYHETLIENLIVECKGGPSSQTWEIFLALYNLVRIQLTCYWLAKGWTASTMGEATLVSILEKAMDQIDGGSVLKSTSDYFEALEQFVHPNGAPK